MVFYFLFFSLFSIRISDLSDFQFPSASACPSLASSPVVARRDSTSILKHSGSVKNTDRRVSIKQNQPIVVEYLCEKRQSTSQQQSHSVNAQQQTTTANGVNQLGKSNARPASLILTKGERPTFKLIRTPSIDQDQDDTTLINPTHFTDQSANAKINNPPTTTNNNNNAHHLIASDLNSKDDDDEDESAPLVQHADKDTTKITSSINHS